MTLPSLMAARAGETWCCNFCCWVLDADSVMNVACAHPSTIDCFGAVFLGMRLQVVRVRWLWL